MALGICIAAGAKTIAIAATSFTLGWTHSVQKTEWIEHWVVEPQGLRVVEAKIKGSGAGMDPPDGAVLRDGWFVYSPDVPAQAEMVLAASGMTGSGWRLCAAGNCRDIATEPAEPVRVKPCNVE